MDQVDDIKSKIDIVDVVGERLTLKKAGSNYKANCPFHNEKTPSFMVSPELQMFKCFGCGESGDVLTFLEKYEAMDFYEALKYLADRVGVKLNTPKHQLGSDRSKILKINELATKFYQYVLLKHHAGKIALKYLLEARGLQMDTLKQFKIGYSPDQPLAMRSFLIAKHNFTLQDLAKAGLIYVRDRKGYDRFRGRVIFPLHDNRGNVLGFSGRILPNDKSENLAKYINSPETSVYHKSANLFGLHLVKKEVKNKDEAIVVEGELDMISSWQIGIKNIVAIKGSAFTQDQVKLLRRYARKVVLALDADIAGDAAARRGIMIAQAEGMDIAVTNLGKYKDPDDAARSDPQFLKKALENATDIWDFLVNSLFSKYDVNTSQDRNKISREVVPILLSIEDDIVQAHYVTKVAKKLNVPVDAVIKAVSKAGTSLTNIDNSYSMQADIKKEDRQAILEKRLIALSFLTDPVYLLDDKVNTFFTTTFAKRILEELVNYYRKADKKNFSIAEFTKKLPRELVDGFSSLFIKESSDLPSVDDKIVNKERDLVIKELEILKVKGELARLGNNVLAAEKKGKSKDILTANRAFSEQTQKLANLENE